MNELKIAVLETVRELTEGEPLEIWSRSGRIVVRAFNECGHNYTEIDLMDLLGWARNGGYECNAVLPSANVSTTSVTDGSI